MAVSDGPNILLDKPIMLIGRHQECDIQIPSRKISRRHCCIAQVHDYLVVRDLSSTNGIRINGMRVNEGQLKAGDELTIGNFRYEVHWDGGPAAPIATASPAAPPVGLPVVGGFAPVTAPKKDVPPPIVAPPGDNPFDSCDDPIALPEPEGAHAKLPPILPTNATAPPVHRQDPAAPPFAFPDSVKLAPLNDSHVPPAP